MSSNWLLHDFHRRLLHFVHQNIHTRILTSCTQLPHIEGTCKISTCPQNFFCMLSKIHATKKNCVECPEKCDRALIVRRAGLFWSQQDFEWRWSVPLFKCLTVLEFSFILFDLCLLITFFNFIMNYVPIVTFWIFTYHKIWILSIMFCFIWSYWIIYFLACLEVSWRVVS